MQQARYASGGAPSGRVSPSKRGKLEKTHTPCVYRKTGARSKPYVLQMRVEGGQRKQSFRTYDEARRAKHALMAARDSGELQARCTITFRDYLTDWIDSYRGNGKQSFRENTREGYRHWLDKYAHAYFPKSLKLTDVTPLHMARFVQWLGEQGLASGSITNAVTPIKSALSEARRNGLIKSNPAQGVVIPRQSRIEEEDDEQVKALSREQLKALLDLVPKQYALFIELMASTGLRVSEAIAVRNMDFSLDGSKPHLRVRRAIVRGNTGPPKSKHGRRSVPLPAMLVFKLREHLSALEDQAPDALAFPSRNGTPLDHDNIRARYLKPLMEEVGAPWAGFHALRHTYASIQLANRCNLLALSRALGHHSASFTLSTYAHLLPGDEAPPLDLNAALATQPDDAPSNGQTVGKQSHTIAPNSAELVSL